MKRQSLISAALTATLLFGTALAWAAPEHSKAESSEVARGKGESPEHESGRNEKEAKEAEEEAEEAGPPGEINWTDFGNKKQPPLAALIFNFALLLFLYYRFGKEPVAQGLKERRDTVAKDIEQAAQILAEAEQRAETYQAKLEAKDEDAEAARTGLVQAGQGEKERIVKDAADKAARLKRDAAFLAEQEVKQMQIDLVRQTVEKAIEDAEALLAKGVTQADQERLAEEYLSTLGTHKAVGT